MEDIEKIDRIKSNLRAYLNANPNAENAEKVRQILMNFQANAPSLPLPSHQMKQQSDADLGIESGPIKADPNNWMDRLAGTGEQLPGGKNERASEPPPPKRIPTELEGDPIAQDILLQAETMPLLHVAGLGLSALGGKMLQTRAGQAAKFLSEHGAPVAAPKPASFLEPAPEFDPMGDIARARGMLALKPPATALHMGSLGALFSPIEAAARNAAPLVGRAAVPIARAGLKLSTGTGPLSLDLAGSPLLQAAAGRE